MIPSHFVSKWSKSELKERSACQEHFTDLCRLVGHPTPAEADPLEKSYCFERFAEKLDGRDGFAGIQKQRRTEKQINRDGGDERQKQASSLSLSSLLNSLSSVVARLDEARELCPNETGGNL